MSSDRWCLGCGEIFDGPSAPATCPRCGQRLVARAAFQKTGLESLTPHTPPSLRPPEVEEAAADPANRFERYTLIRELGSGGAGSVWKAWDPEQNRFVAIKILREATDRNEARFARESYAATRLSHPNIVKVHRTGAFENRSFIAMELIQGRTLAALLADPARPPLDHFIRAFKTVCEAIHHAHANGVVHRDLKPLNILLDLEGHPYVVDFGIARPREPGWTLTLGNQAIGTPQYMSPEQARGGDPGQEPSTDIYGLGAVLYHILTGRPPFTGTTHYDVLTLVINEPPIRPRSLAGSVPADLETIAMKCLEKDPARRYGSAMELADDVGRWLAREPIAARPASLGTRVWRRALRHKAVLVPLAIALVAAIAGGGAALRSRARSLAREEAFALLEAARPHLDQAAVLEYSPAVTAGALAEVAGRASPSVEKALQRDPALPAAHHLRGVVRAYAGDRDGAEESWRKALELDPGYAPSMLHLGRRLQARAFLATFWGVEGERPERLAEARRHAEEARRLLAAAVEAQGVEDELQREVARALLAYTADDRSSAAAIARAALGKHDGRPGAEELHWIVAMSSDGRERFDAFQRALRIRPRFAKVRVCLGALRFLERDLDGAVKEYDEALAVEPRMAPAWSNRGMALHHLGDPAGAIEDHEKAIAIDPGYAFAWQNRGAARADLRDWAGAVADYTEALRIHPGFPHAYTGRALARQALGDKSAAVDDLRAALKAAPPAWPQEAMVRKLLSDWTER